MRFERPPLKFNFDKGSLFHFINLVERENNYFALFLTICQLAQNLYWPQYVSHMVELLHRLHFLICESEGEVLREISSLREFQ